MNLCRVLGTVVATEKHPAFAGRKLLVVQPVDPSAGSGQVSDKALGKSFIAIDHSSSAGKGDLVLVLREGTGVRQVVGDKMAPIRSLIVGVVDSVDVD